MSATHATRLHANARSALRRAGVQISDNTNGVTILGAVRTLQGMEKPYRATPEIIKSELTAWLATQPAPVAVPSGPTVYERGELRRPDWVRAVSRARGAIVRGASLGIDHV